MPLNHLAENLEKLPKDRPLLVYCAGGYRSSIAASLLQRGGFSPSAKLPAASRDGNPQTSRCKLPPSCIYASLAAAHFRGIPRLILVLGPARLSRRYVMRITMFQEEYNQNSGVNAEVHERNCSEVNHG